MATTISRLDTRELRAWRGLLRVHAQLSKALDAQLLAEHGLPLTSYEVLMYLSDSDGGRMRMNELAASVLLSRSGLTRAGREKVDAARITHLAGVREHFLSNFSSDELDVLGEAWDRVLSR